MTHKYWGVISIPQGALRERPLDTCPMGLEKLPGLLPRKAGIELGKQSDILLITMAETGVHHHIITVWDIGVPRSAGEGALMEGLEGLDPQ